jgi:hypothetical protein
MAAKATVDKSTNPWTWTWGEVTALLPSPPEKRHGFLDFEIDSEGTFHFVTTSAEAFSFDNPDGPITTAIHYFRSTTPFEIHEFEHVDQPSETVHVPVQVPEFAMGYGGEAAVDFDASGNAIVVYSDHSLYQAGVQEATWTDPGFRGQLYIKRYRKSGSEWQAQSPKTITRGVYGDSDMLVDPDGTVHLVYTIIESGSSYRVAYREIGKDNEIGTEILLSESDLSAVERTIFPSLARLDDGSLVVAFTDRKINPDGDLAAVVRGPEASAFSCAVALTHAPNGASNVNLHVSEVNGRLPLVHLVGPKTDNNAHELRYGAIDVSELRAAVQAHKM